MGTLRNIEAIGKMVQGDHKFQTRTTFGFSDSEAAASKNKKREVGEVWIETNPETGAQYRVEQMKGYRRRESVQGYAIRQALGEGSFLYSKCYSDCEKKTSANYSYLDKKVGLKTQMCLDCLTRYETSLRIKGKDVFDQYALNKMKSNAEAWLKQADQEVELIKAELAKSPTYVHADGREEKWTAENMSGFIEKIDQDYKKFKEELLTNLEYGNIKDRGVDVMASDSAD